MNKLNEHKELATLCYISAMRKRIEQEQREKYAKRIDYLVGANNELMAALEVCESEIITVEKENGSIEFTASEEFRIKGASVDDEVDDRDDFAAAAVVTKKKRES